MLSISIKLNIALLLQSCPGKIKCLSGGIALGSLTSFLYGCLIGFHFHQTQCILHKSNSSKYITRILPIAVIQDFKCAYGLITFKGLSRDDLFVAKCYRVI